LITYNVEYKALRTKIGFLGLLVGLTEINAFLVGNLGLQETLFISHAVSLTLALGLPSLNLHVSRHCGPNSGPLLITLHSPHPFGNRTLNFGEHVLSNRSQGPFSVTTVHFIAESTQWKN
jgi:hypothetical protein